MNSAPTTLRIVISILSNYISFIRYIPISTNTRFNNACDVIDRISRKLVEDKYLEAKNNELKGNDLLTLLINLNKKLPTEEKMSMDELKYQVIKKIGLQKISFIKYIFTYYIIIYYILDYDISSSGT
jgi:hypothetical protein